MGKVRHQVATTAGCKHHGAKAYRDTNIRRTSRSSRWVSCCCCCCSSGTVFIGRISFLAGSLSKQSSYIPQSASHFLNLPSHRTLSLPLHTLPGLSLEVQTLFLLALCPPPPTHIPASVANNHGTLPTHAQPWPSPLSTKPPIRSSAPTSTSSATAASRAHAYARSSTA